MTDAAPSREDPLVAALREENERLRAQNRLLTEQSARAPGGERSYRDEHGRLTGGWAVVAWPATYDNSGVMTFQINHRGIVYQKDLGKGTAKAVAKIQAFEPDEGWTPVSD